MKIRFAPAMCLGLLLFGAIAMRPAQAGVRGEMQVGLRIRSATELPPTYRQSVQRALIDSGTPRNVVLAALISAPVGREDVVTADERVADGAALAGDDALVQWLAANRLLDAHDTRAVAAIDRLTQIEHDNAAAWLLALSFAASHDDRAGVDDALAHMAAGTRADEHMAETLRAWLAVYEGHPRPSAAFANPAEAEAAPFVEAMSAATAAAMPSYEPFARACDASQDAARARACADAAHTMLYHATSLSARSVGFAVLRRLGDAYLTPADRATQRDIAWLIENAGRASGFADLDRAAMDAHREDWRRLDDETEIAQRALRRMGLTVRAPSGWIPPAIETIARADAR